MAAVSFAPSVPIKFSEDEVVTVVSRLAMHRLISSFRILTVRKGRRGFVCKVQGFATTRRVSGSPGWFTGSVVPSSTSS